MKTALRITIAMIAALFPIAPGICSGATEAVEVSPSIHVDQIGYRTSDAKQVLVAGRGGPFEIRDQASGRRVYSGQAVEPVEDDSSGDMVYTGDFSSLAIPGTYYVSVAGLGKSYDFSISANVYARAKDIVEKGLYFQRCGIALKEKFAGVWKHGACHLKDGTIFGTDVKRDGTGGWHDAGDYGRYTAPGAVAAADLLLAYDLFPSAFSDAAGIPESGNGVADVLDEARYELEWLLKMQDPDSGGVYHKLSSAGFPELTTMPDEDMSSLVFYPISAAATADFAAVMAMAARVYQPLDDAFAVRCLAASESAWNWLTGNPSVPGFRNPPGVTSGEYGDDNDRDERFWAAAELFRTTGENPYNQYIAAALTDKDLKKTGFGWQRVGGFGTLAYCLTDENKTDKAIVRSLLKDAVISPSKANLAVRKNDGYRVSLRQQDYIWGSNMNLMNQAMLFIVTDRLNPDKELLGAALDDLHYLFGRNALSQCYVTALGGKPVMHPHNRPSLGDYVDPPVPGLVSGGPNRFLQDPFARSSLQDQPPARCYTDDAASYSTNEIAIYYNAPVVFVVAAFSGRE
jgi:endoglucanase